MTGPYIITTKTPTRVTSPTYGWVDDERVSRLAVATLDVCHEHLIQVVTDADLPSESYWAARNDIDNLSESGGTVGPLPDGTTIEVEAMTWERLAELAGLGRGNWSNSHEEILAAFNEQEAAKA